MRRVCHVISGLGVGGAEMNLYRLLKGLNRDRVECSIVSLLPGGPVADLIAALGLPVESLNLRPGIADPRGITRLSRLLRRWKPDLVQTWMYHADLLGALTAAWLHRLPVVWNVRASNMDMTRYSAVSGMTVRACARLSGVPDAIVVNSESGRHHHEAIGYRARSWWLIPNGIDTREFRPDAEARRSVRHELGLGDDVVAIGVAARVDPMKDHETFLDAARLLARDHPRVRFVLAGTGVDSPAFRARIGADPCLAARCHLLGPRGDLPRVMAGWDIAVSSSRSEGLPTAVAEAMACGVPCVVTDVGDSAALVGDTGVVAPPGRADLLADACRQLLMLDNAERRKRGERARARVETHYGLARTVARYEECYRSLRRRNALCVD